jgi:2,3,4,5-tetrahydropyridine-2-carboxylate N-succinyltransferase
MSNEHLEIAIEAAWDARDTITPATTGETRDAIETTLIALDSGKLRVAEKQETGDWHVNQWAKKAVLLGFRLKDMELQAGSAQGGSWWDKVDSKWAGWGTDDWTAAGFRAGAQLRCAQISLHRPRCRFDAFFCEPRRLCRQRHHG